MAEEAQKPAQGRELEEKIEGLTKELSGLINEGGTGARDELREYAVSLIQGGTETVLMEEPTRQDETEDTPSFSVVALSIPFLLIGIILLPLFAPVGLAMLLLALVMGVGGWLALMFRRR